MRLLADARPRRLEPDGRPDPAPYTAHPRQEASRRRNVPRRLVLAGALPAVAAAAVAAVVLTGGGTAPVPTPPPGETGAAAAAPPGSARELLLVAAAKTDAVGTATSGRYRVRVQEYGERKEVGPAGGRYGMAVRFGVERWQATAAGDPSVEVQQDLGAVPVTPADEAAWQADGSPARWTENGPRGTTPIVRTTTPGPRIVRPMRGGPPLMIAGQTVTAADLAGLPAEPAALKAWVAARLRQGGSTENVDAALFYAGRDLVAELPVSAAVRSAAYRMLADLPGVDFLGVVQDRQGRSGMAVASTRRGDGGWGQQRLIVDPSTGRALAQESWFFGSGGAPAATGTLMSWTVQVSVRYTDDAAPTP
jgi:hypothetical protein